MKKKEAHWIILDDVLRVEKDDDTVYAVCSHCGALEESAYEEDYKTMINYCYSCGRRMVQPMLYAEKAGKK